MKILDMFMFSFHRQWWTLDKITELQEPGKRRSCQYWLMPMDRGAEQKCEKTRKHLNSMTPPYRETLNNMKTFLAAFHLRQTQMTVAKSRRSLSDCLTVLSEVTCARTQHSGVCFRPPPPNSRSLWSPPFYLLRTNLA